MQDIDVWNFRQKPIVGRDALNTMCYIFAIPTACLWEVLRPGMGTIKLVCQFWDPKNVNMLNFKFWPDHVPVFEFESKFSFAS